MTFTKEGSIAVYEQETLDVQKEASIFNLKSEDYLSLILIWSKEYIIFTLEKQWMDFFSVGTFKKTDSWDYFFDQDLTCSHHNEEGSKIAICDKGGYFTLFNFIRNVDNGKGLVVSSNRWNDAV